MFDEYTTQIFLYNNTVYPRVLSTDRSIISPSTGARKKDFLTNNTTTKTPSLNKHIFAY